MRKYIFLLTILIINFQSVSSQQYDSVFIEKDSVNLNNSIYKPGNVFIYDYEIIDNNKVYKLNENTRGKPYKLVSIKSDSVKINEVHLAVKSEGLKYNPNQTRISYYQLPILLPFSSTGAVENKKNTWIHPIRIGFFKSLETCPFPFIKAPYEIGNTWEDKMVIGNNWSDKKWGNWKGNLLLEYYYIIKEKRKIKTSIGEIECYVIESHTHSEIGKTKLTSFYSEKYGFVRLEYELSTKIKVNFWLIDLKKDKKFHDMNGYYKTKNYIKN